MTDAARLLLCLQMADSAFPSGGFAFSWGLETLKADGLVTDGAGVAAFARAQFARRWASFDRPALRRAAAAGGDMAALVDLDLEIEALTPAAEMREGSRRAGRGLLRVHAGLATPGAEACLAAVRGGRALGHLPLAQGVVWSGAGLCPRQAEALSAFAQASAVAQAAVRLALIGPLQAQRLIAELRPEIFATLARPSPDRLSSFAPLAEIAVMRHEVAETRLFAN